jgi:hypothetical protein
MAIVSSHAAMKGFVGANSFCTSGNARWVASLLRIPYQ